MTISTLWTKVRLHAKSAAAAAAATDSDFDACGQCEVIQTQLDRFNAHKKICMYFK